MLLERHYEDLVRQISENAGVEGSIVIGKLLEQNDNNFGFDAQTETYTDLVKSGIIDPVKVVELLLKMLLQSLVCY